MSKADWDGRSDGWFWLIRVGSVLIRVLGFRGVALASLPIAWLVTASSPRLRSICVDYWRRQRPGIDRAAASALAVRQLAGFARVLCDRGLVYLRRGSFRYERHRAEPLLAAAARGEGFILISAHLGNWELAGRLFARIEPRRAINLVKVENEDPRERDMVAAAMGDHPPKIIDPRDPVAASLAIRQALSRGEVVCFLGDRVHGDQPSLAVPILGAPARLPIGPFQVAQITGAPILRCFLMRRGHGHYRMEVDPPQRIPAPRDRRARRAAIADAVEDWGRRLERQMRRYPFQWHNFYRYWS